MVRVGEIVDVLEAFAPLEYAEDWDNCGLHIGSLDDRADNVLVCLDLTVQALEHAVDNDIKLIITHHPIFFEPVKTINTDTYTGRLVSRAIRHGISVYCAHTNLDNAKGGVSDTLAGILGIEDITPCGTGRIGTSPHSDFDILCSDICRRLHIDGVRAKPGASKRISRAAVFCGACGDGYIDAIEARADVIIAGEIKHHAAKEALDLGIGVIEAGHYDTEKHMISIVAGFLIRAQGLQNRVKVVQLFEDRTTMGIRTLRQG
ncbi:MAG TPA: Nif3-like dinuclear metal center hexameric protein [Clostridia bacterium]|nr:Nif3-like dinuclear metal center hexameric protein [Clostridia bacterium]